MSNSTTYWNIDSADGNELSAGIQLESEARRIAQSTANRMGQSVYLYEVGNGDGESEVESEEIEPEEEDETESEEERVKRAAAKLDATELADGRWAHRDDAMGRWYVVSASDLSELCDYLDDEDEQISRDAYSHWCAGTSAQEMPKDWTPEFDDNVRTAIEDVKFTTPPVNQGQIVTVSYGCDADYIYERAYDASDRSESVTVYEHPEDMEEGEFQPWNGEPRLGEKVGSVELSK